MAKILKKEILVHSPPRIIKMKIEAPFLAYKVKPGQFVILMVSSYGERIPLTVVDKDKKTITLIFQEVGYTTKLLGRLKEGKSLYSLVGPLGNPAPIKKYGKVVAIGGGVGIGLIYPIIKALKKEANFVVSILGAKSKDYLILKKEIEKISDQLFVTTDDGSEGEKGLVTDVLEKVLKKEKFDLAYCVGPLLMMKKVSQITSLYNLRTIASLNPIMIDGTGLCGSCRLLYNGEVRFACCDGPDFDAHLVDFDDLIRRNTRFQEEEKLLYEKDSFRRKKKNI